MKKNLLTITLIISSLSLPAWAMEPMDVDTLTLVTSEGTQHQVDLDVIKSQAGLIRDHLEIFDDLTVPITIPGIDGPAFKQMYNVMALVHLGSGKEVAAHDRMRTEALAKELIRIEVKNDDDLYRVAKAADYLTANNVITLLAETGAQLVHDKIVSIDGVMKVRSDLIHRFAEQVAKNHFLMFGKQATPQELLNLPFGVSIRELLAYGKVPAIESKLFMPKELNLSSKHIKNLDGLKDIPGIDTVNIIDLSLNPGIRVTAGFFDGFKNLRAIHLSDNSTPDNIMKIDAGAFRGVTLSDPSPFGESFLNLSRNPGIEIVRGAFDGLSTSGPNATLGLYDSPNMVIRSGGFSGLSINVGGFASLNLSNSPGMKIFKGSFEGLDLYGGESKIDFAGSDLSQEDRKRVLDDMPENMREEVIF